MSGGTKSGGTERRLRVLVVEDEFVVSATLQGYLEAMGHEVVGTTREAGKAVELARALQPDVVLMDLGLPDGSGAEATRGILAEVRTRVVLVTAYGDERVDEALAAGAHSALTKPITQRQLARAIAEATGAPPARPAQGE